MTGIENAPDPKTGRTRIMSPLTTAPAHVRRTVQQEIDESTGIGEVYVRSLVRSQLRAALTVISTLMLTLGALPVVFWLLDDLNTLELWGIPLPWIVLSVAVYPGLFLLGWLYVRQAERSERDFAALLSPTLVWPPPEEPWRP
ncbi:hypothetical protein [Aeromicrobium sp.]|uniref:hypothetical protein n=1 Tax=Aeromicrobium sp. TaxID=1871063 RepID=UPI003C65620C